MRVDWSASCACIAGVKWAQATKDVHWEESWDEEFAPEHKRRCVGISSKRISHLIKTSAQLPGGLCAAPKQLHMNRSAAPHIWKPMQLRDGFVSMGVKKRRYRYTRTFKDLVSRSKHKRLAFA